MRFAVDFCGRKRLSGTCVHHTNLAEQTKKRPWRFYDDVVNYERLLKDFGLWPAVRHAEDAE